jgi:hypothetical protein
MLTQHFGAITVDKSVAMSARAEDNSPSLRSAE